MQLSNVHQTKDVTNNLQRIHHARQILSVIWLSVPTYVLSGASIDSSLPLSVLYTPKTSANRPK